MGTSTFIAELSSAVHRHRADDPTAPVTVLVATTAEALELRTSLARGDDAALHIGVAVTTPTLLAAHGQVPASALDLTDAVRRQAATGYFARLDGLAGVTDALTAAVLEWDDALPSQRRALLRGAPATVDQCRLQAIEALHGSVAAEVAAEGLSLPSVVLAGDPKSGLDVLWIDATVTALSPIAERWLERLRGEVGEAERFRRVDPGGFAGQSTPADLTSAVDPFDECGLAARAVTSAMEAGVAARDIVVAVPSSVLGRYRDLIGGMLAAAGVPTDVPATSPTRIASTRVGRILTAVGAAAAVLRRPRDLRFDHLAGVIIAGRLPGPAGEFLSDRALSLLWVAVRGSDPAGWPAGVAPRRDQEDADALAEVGAAAVTATTVARALDLARLAAGTPQPWPDLGRAMRPLVPKELVTSEADAAARARVTALLDVWSAREGEARWSQAWEEVVAVLWEASPGASEGVGVRIVPLSAAWATCPNVAVVAGLSDDVVPGSQRAVGPLTADEVMSLRADPASGRTLAEDDARSLAAVCAAATSTHLSYPRSDQLRTIERTPARFLAVEHEHVFGSVGAQFDAVDGGEAGLLGPADAAASILRTGGDPGAIAMLTPAAAVAAAAANTESRRRPPEAGDVDTFNGDVRGLAADQKVLLSPDHRRTGGNWASPSGLESLLGCPIGWWAQRVVGVDEAREWDPAVLAQPNWGKWLHRALVVLSERGVLLADDLTDAHVEEALWVALGGGPDAELDTEMADSEVLGYRFRVTDSDIVRAVREVRVIAGRLGSFLAVRGPREGEPTHEATLPVHAVDLPSGPLPVGGRVDRIDTLSGDHHLITDYKTGRAGSGFQLAVYAWLWLLDRGGEAELLYATTSDRPYEAQSLADGGPTVFVATDLAEFLRAALSDAVAEARDGRFSSGAWAADHSRYCPVCGDLVGARNSWGRAAARGERATALAAVAPPEVAPSQDQEVAS